MWRLSTLLFLTVCILVPIAALSQGQPASDPQALAYASQSLAALTGGTTISDVTLTGNATWSGTSPGTGTATLMALGTNESRMNLSLSTGNRTEIRDGQTGIPLGQWINPDSTSGMFAYQNCQTDPAWFFPALGSLSAGPNVVLSYVGQQTWNGTTVQHIQSYIYQAGASPIPGTTAQQLSTMDFYLSASTLLPVSLTFNAYPDNSTTANLLVEVDFSNYQNVGGVLVPTQIQKSTQGSQLVSVTITGAAFNTGLPLSDFAISQ